MMSWLVNIKYFNTWKTNLRQPYCKDRVSGFLLMVYTSLLQTGNERYQLINSEFKVAFLRYWTFSQLFFLNSCKVSYWSLLGSLFLVFYHRLGLCRFSQIEKKPSSVSFLTRLSCSEILKISILLPLFQYALNGAYWTQFLGLDQALWQRLFLQVVLLTHLFSPSVSVPH